ILAVGPVPTDTDAGPPVPFLLAIVVQRPIIRPAVVGRPGRVAALEEKVAGPVVADDEDQVTLQFLLFGGQLAEVDATGPVCGGEVLRHRPPAALAQALGAPGRVSLAWALKGAEPTQVPAALALVITEPIQIDDEWRRRVGADHDGQGVAAPHAGVRAVALDPGAAVLRLRIDSGI